MVLIGNGCVLIIYIYVVDVLIVLPPCRLVYLLMAVVPRQRSASAAGAGRPSTECLMSHESERENILNVYWLAQCEEEECRRRRVGTSARPSRRVRV